MNNPKYIDEAVAVVESMMEEMGIIRDCCVEALREDWDRSDQGFIDFMRNACEVEIAKARKLLKMVDKE